MAARYWCRIVLEPLETIHGPLDPRPSLSASHHGPWRCGSAVVVFPLPARRTPETEASMEIRTSGPWMWIWMWMVNGGCGWMWCVHGGPVRRLLYAGVGGASHCRVRVLWLPVLLWPLLLGYLAEDAHASHACRRLSKHRRSPPKTAHHRSLPLTTTHPGLPGLVRLRPTRRIRTPGRSCSTASAAPAAEMFWTGETFCVTAHPLERLMSCMPWV